MNTESLIDERAWKVTLDRLDIADKDQVAIDRIRYFVETYESVRAHGPDAVQSDDTNYQGAMADLEELVRVAIQNGAGLDGFLRDNYPQEYAKYGGQPTRIDHTDSAPGRSNREKIAPIGQTAVQDLRERFITELSNRISRHEDGRGQVFSTDLLFKAVDSFDAAMQEFMGAAVKRGPSVSASADASATRKDAGPAAPTQQPSDAPAKQPVDDPAYVFCVESKGKIADALCLVLPMAKGYAAQHPVGSNQKYIEIAEAALGVTVDERPREIRLTEDEAELLPPPTPTGQEKPGDPVDLAFSDFWGVWYGVHRGDMTAESMAALIEDTKATIRDERYPKPAFIDVDSVTGLTGGKK